MAIAGRSCETYYGLDGEALVIACTIPAPRPSCAYCNEEGSRLCDAPGKAEWGRCGQLMCQTHARAVGRYHHLCREHATGDHWATIRAGLTATNVFWEIVQTKAIPLPVGSRPPRLKVPGVVDPDDEDCGDVID